MRVLSVWLLKFYFITFGSFFEKFELKRVMKQKCCLSISNTSAGLMLIKEHVEFPKLKGVLVLMHKLTDR